MNYMQAMADIFTCDLCDACDALGISASPTSVDDYSAFVEAETERWGRLVRISGAQAE